MSSRIARRVKISLRFPPSSPARSEKVTLRSASRRPRHGLAVDGKGFLAAHRRKAAEGLYQIEQVHLDEILLRRRRIHGNGTGPLEDVSIEETPLAQFQGGFLEGLVFQELPHQIGPGVLLFRGLVLAGGGQEHAGLDVEQGRGHDEVLPRQVQVQGTHAIQGGEVLFRDQGDGDVGDVDLVLLDEMEQKVQGTCKDVEADFIRHRQSGRPL